MRKVKLSQKEIKDLLKIEDPFKKRDYIQEIGITIFKQSKGKLVVTWATSLGKSVFAIKIINKFRRLSLKPIHITVPTLTLKDQWIKKLKGIPNVEVFTTNAYSSLQERKPLLLIADECHLGLSSDNGEHFNKINSFPAKYKLYLSATLRKAQKEFIEKSTGIKTEFNLDVSEALLLGFVPEFKIYNVYCDFTKEEKELYKKAINQEKKCISYFGHLGIEKRPNIKKFPVFLESGTNKDITKEAKFMAALWLKSTSKRCSIIYNAKEKIETIQKITSLLQRKTIIISKTQKTANEISKLCNILPYHVGIRSKKAEENLTKFLNNTVSKISSVNKLISGLDDEVTEAIIRHSFSSTASEGIQSLGRTLRINPNDPSKSPVMINLIMKPYEDVIPSDNYWINISLKGLESEYVTVEQLTTLL